MTLLASLIAIAGWLPYWLWRVSRELHILQLEEYQSARFLRLWTPARSLDLILLPGQLVLIVGAFVLPGWTLAAAAVWAAVHVARFVLRPKLEAKKPLVWTARIKRLLALTIAFTAVAVLVVVALAGWSVAVLFIALAVAAQAAALAVVVGNMLAYPVEAQVRQYYLRKAHSRLKAVHPLVIGVTGSYGKTSTKEILAKLLSAKGETLKPPGSYNTLLGVCRVINERLRDDHEFFVVEMGDYQRGDIAALCRLTGPSAGVLTTIGPEHLERFGSMENIELSKIELIDALPPDGFVVLNSDDPRLCAIGERVKNVRVVWYGIDPAYHPSVRAENIQTSATGVAFDLVLADGTRTPMQSRLLGQHNVNNLLAGIAVALELGLDLALIQRTISEIEPPEHRLQLLPPTGGATIIDDAYNANPVGVKAALDVLAEFPARRRVLVTPGMVELGPIEADENRRFGEHAAGVCDYVILVGPRRTAPIADGLKSAGFPNDRAIVVRGLAEATDALRGMVTTGDVVLFCNDLPDQYAE